MTLVLLWKIEGGRGLENRREWEREDREREGIVDGRARKLRIKAHEFR